MDPKSQSELRNLSIHIRISLPKLWEMTRSILSCLAGRVKWWWRMTRSILSIHSSQNTRWALFRTSQICKFAEYALCLFGREGEMAMVESTQGPEQPEVASILWTNSILYELLIWIAKKNGWQKKSDTVSVYCIVKAIVKGQLWKREKSHCDDFINPCIFYIVLSSFFSLSYVLNLPHKRAASSAVILFAPFLHFFLLLKYLS